MTFVWQVIHHWSWQGKLYSVDCMLDIILAFGYLLLKHKHWGLQNVNEFNYPIYMSYTDDSHILLRKQRYCNCKFVITKRWDCSRFLRANLNCRCNPITFWKKKTNSTWNTTLSKCQPNKYKSMIEASKVDTKKHSL